MSTQPIVFRNVFSKKSNINITIDNDILDRLSFGEYHIIHNYCPQQEYKSIFFRKLNHLNSIVNITFKHGEPNTIDEQKNFFNSIVNLYLSKEKENFIKVVNWLKDNCLKDIINKPCILGKTSYCIPNFIVKKEQELIIKDSFKNLVNGDYKLVHSGCQIENQSINQFEFIKSFVDDYNNDFKDNQNSIHDIVRIIRNSELNNDLVIILTWLIEPNDN